VFSGTECLEIVNPPELRTQTFTVALWFKTSMYRVSTILGVAYQAETDTTNAWELWHDTAMNLNFNTVTVNRNLSSSSYQVDTWIHLAATFDGITKRLYFDGIEVANANASTTMFDAEPIRIGCDRQLGVTGGNFIGELDEIRFYDRTLTPADIALLAP
jgi:hypothetical protein